MGEEKDLLSSLLLELRRGTLTISVLSQMKDRSMGMLWYRAWKKKALPLTPTPCILSFAGLRIRGFWKASGNRWRKTEKILSADKIRNRNL